MACGLDDELVGRLGVGCEIQMLQHVRIIFGGSHEEDGLCTASSSAALLHCTRCGGDARLAPCRAKPWCCSSLSLSFLRVWRWMPAAPRSRGRAPWQVWHLQVSCCLAWQWQTQWPPGHLVPGRCPCGWRRPGWLGSALCRPGVSAGGGSCTYA